MVVLAQLNFMRQKDLGFDRSHVFFFAHREDFAPFDTKFKSELMGNPALQNVIRSTYNPMQILGGLVLADDAWPGKTSADDQMFFNMEAEPELLSSLGFSFVQGKNFSGGPSDSSSYVINEAAARVMHLSDPVGTTIKAPTQGTIIGVIKNFHSNPLRESFQPIIISTRYNDFGVTLVKYTPGKMRDALAAVESAYAKFAPDLPLEIKFMDDTFAEQYGDEIRLGRLATICTGIAIFISCIGLFGLVSFSAARRKKEIGIRKVLGADAYRIVSLLCRDTFVLLLIACVIGIPLAVWASTKFLSGFAFHTTINYWAVSLVVGAMLLLAMLTISFQSVRASLANPGETLKSE
jgi:putative ABC transport system permease protein